jgi:hypothetical protein
MEKAAECLEQLLKLDPSDMTTLARLVLLYSQVNAVYFCIFFATFPFYSLILFQFDPAAAQKKSQQLPPLELDAGVSALDVDALEAATWAIGLKHSRKTPAGGLL